MKSTIILLLLFGLSSCNYNVFPPKVDTRTEIHCLYKTKINGYHQNTKRKSKLKTGYKKYDVKGNLIEDVEYGEKWSIRSVVKNADSTTSVTISNGRNYKNINTIHYYVYDSLNRKTQGELWKFKNNKKYYLMNKTIFKYDVNGKLIMETELDENNKIIRFQDYSIDEFSTSISKDSVFNSSHDGIDRVIGRGQDTTIRDSLGRPIEKFCFDRGKFLNRREYRYDRWGDIVTEIVYDGKPDSLWSITEWQYNIDKQLIRKFWKVIGEKIETKDIYIYNRKKLLIKILHYKGEELIGYTFYKYRLH